MLTILLHSSKTMRSQAKTSSPYQKPQFVNEAIDFMAYAKKLSSTQLAKTMHLSPSMAKKTHTLLQNWTSSPNKQSPAIDVFLGDIYSGLQAQTFTASDRRYANQHLFILSGLYGILKALDSIYPYRLEMGYRFPQPSYKNLYHLWGEKLASALPPTGTIVNLSSVEYTKAILPYIAEERVITPKFMTRHPKTKQPTFVVVHAKIARGAFAHWMIQRRIDTLAKLVEFNELGYYVDLSLSTIESPVFVCDSFQGLGLSVRLT